MVVVGLAVTVEPVVEDKPVAGDQVYEVAPLTVNEVLLPKQIVADAGVTLIVGNGFTVTVKVKVCPTHPFICGVTV